MARPDARAPPTEIPGRCPSNRSEVNQAEENIMPHLKGSKFARDAARGQAEKGPPRRSTSRSTRVPPWNPGRIPVSISFRDYPDGVGHGDPERIMSHPRRFVALL